ncbi:MAG: helix-turn-helix domain-containing protein [Pseudoclavibacter sp.]|nr:helix-turn-helix domain-containing protein [Pseudoclavibacter sp.]
MPDAAGATARAPHSQTLSRGITVLELLNERQQALTIQQIADALGLHRSIAYRILRTLEAHGLVDRDGRGRIRLGPGLAALARGVAPDLRQLAAPELGAVADAFEVTAFLAVLDRREVITLLSAEPRRAHAPVAQRPGTRHGVERGAPGIAVQLAMTEAERERLAADGVPIDRARLDRARADGYALSSDEVIPGLTSIAVPLRVPDDPQPATLAVVTIRAVRDAERIAENLREAAGRIAARAC